MKKALFFVFLITFCFATPAEEKCPFCEEKILERQAFYRGDEALALLTHQPAVPGHVLIIPKRHVERFEQLTHSEIAEMGQLIKKVDAVIRRVHQTTGHLLVQKNGREAGQSVPHVHFHYLPCSQGDSQLLLAIRFLTSHWFHPLTPDEMVPLIADLQKKMLSSF